MRQILRKRLFEPSVTTKGTVGTSLGVWLSKGSSLIPVPISGTVMTYPAPR